MAPVIWNLTGLVLLLAALLAGDARLQARHPLQGRARLGRAVVLAATAGGLIGALPWWLGEARAFSWVLPPLAFRFLAVAGVSFGLLGLLALARPDSARPGQMRGLLLVYLLPLAGVIVLRHRDRFDPGAPVVIAFFAIVAALIAGAAFALPRPPRPRLPDAGPERAMAALAGIWGLALFLWPAGPWPPLWPWPQDALSSRLIGVMFVTVAAGFALAPDRASLTSARLLAASYGAGVALASALALAAGRPAPLAYPLIWGAIALLATARLISARAAAPSPGQARPETPRS